MIKLFKIMMTKMFKKLSKKIYQFIYLIKIQKKIRFLKGKAKLQTINKEENKNQLWI